VFFDALIVSISVLMLLYWFRYTCLLMLRTKPGPDFTRKVAAANHLSFVDVRSRLAQPSAPEQLDELHRMLDRDYRLVMYLIRHAEKFQAPTPELEHRMLMLDFHVMRLRYRVSKRFSASQSLHSLDEMARIIAHFANVMGERAASTA
jgi:hypothetical protein